MIIRPATAKDLAAIVKLLVDDELGSTREVVLTSLNSNYEIALDKILNNPNQIILVAEMDNKIIATCELSFMFSLTHQGSTRMNIEGVRVDKSFRNRGIGRSLITRALEIAKTRECKIAQLTTNKSRLHAQEFYQSLGFKATHEGMKLELEEKNHGW
jgi:ribosomal protein S18 acetylase RimI-like enzyme